jgi:hypothetical protein
MKAMKTHVTVPVVDAWMVIFGAPGLMLVALALYHPHILPSGGEERKSESVRQIAATYNTVVLAQCWENTPGTLPASVSKMFTVTPLCSVPSFLGS